MLPRPTNFGCFTPSATWPKWPIFLVSLRPWCKIALRTMTSMWNSARLNSLCSGNAAEHVITQHHQHPNCSLRDLLSSGEWRERFGAMGIQWYSYSLLNGERMGSYQEFPNHILVFGTTFGCLALISSKFFTSYLPEIAICCSKWALSLFDIVWLKAIFNICI